MFAVVCEALSSDGRRGRLERANQPKAEIPAGWKSTRKRDAATAARNGGRSMVRGQSDGETCALEARRLPRARAALPAIVVSSSALGGCATRGAPSFELFGAFFPAWMLCAVIGIAAGAAARVVFIAVGLDNILQFRLLVCSSVGVIVAALAWLFRLGQ